MTSRYNVTWGWSGLSHDASLAVFVDGNLEYASHSERHSKRKNDPFIHAGLMHEALKYGPPEKIFFYETPWLKKIRQLYAGQYNLLKKPSPDYFLALPYEVMKKAGLPLNTWLDETEKFPASGPLTDKLPKSIFTRHHLAHAAGGYYTSDYDDATIVVLDSIGEWETFTIWRGEGNNLKKVYSQSYPHSVGIWYSAMTQRIGLKPQEHEYILMGMAAIGDPDKYYDIIKKDFIAQMPTKKNPYIKFKRNCHRGCMDWRPYLKSVQEIADIASATQRIYEEIFVGIIEHARHANPSKNLVLMGGCTLNCVANSLAAEYYDNIWIMPNPGDAGSAIGCVLAHTKERIEFKNPFLGTDIPGEYPIEELLEDLHELKITAVASGRAEFGPRALGNRSILADPRGSDVKDRVNKIKQREAFRPFAPMILEEHVDKYFEMPVKSSPYMQFVAKCKKPKEFPAIVHYDDTSRVQTVDKDMGPVRTLLERWYKETGCPMLLNTSLNIKGKPLVNCNTDAQQWSANYGVDICLPR